MSEKLPITVTIITRNEEKRIEAAIQSVKNFAKEIIVIDSNSTDRTAEIARGLGAQFIAETFRGFGQQKNRAHRLANEEWVLNIDADERISKALEDEIRAQFLNPAIQSIDGFYLPRKTWYLNRWVMHGGWYPNYLVRLSRKSKSSWTEPNLHEELKVQGAVKHLREPIEHFSFPNQASHILKNVEYAGHAMMLLQKKGKRARFIDFTLKPIWKFFDGYILKRGFLDGRAGLFIAIHSAYALFLRYAYLHELEAAQNPDSR